MRGTGIITTMILAAAGAAGEAPPDAEGLTPGTETRLAAPVAKGSFIVYVPADYDPEKRWPVIFCYPGAGQSATTRPFVKVTGGAGFVVAGMNYLDEKKGLLPEGVGREKAYFTEALGILRERLSIDPDLVFMGGVSQGGFATTVLGEQCLDTLAGFVILCAGRSYGEHLPPPADAVTGLPIFIGVGAKDRFCDLARRTSAFYRGLGAETTLEEWPGLGHEFDPEKTALGAWLSESLPRAKARRDLNRARDADDVAPPAPARIP